MFALRCTITDSTVLLSASSIVALRNTPQGITVILECHCGEHLALVDTSDTPQPVAA